MNFLSMEYFLAVEKERNFTRAAEKLHITQQTLGAHIANIEKDLGCPLFIRHVPLELTYAGEVFKGYAEIFQRTLRSMKTEFRDITGNQTGVLRIGISMTRSRALMPGILRKFQKKYPGYEVELVEGTNETHQQNLLNEEIDLAIANFTETVPGISFYPFYEEEVVLLISDALLQEIYAAEAPEILKACRSGNFSRLQECPFALGNPDDMAGKIGRRFLQKEHIKPAVKVLSSNIETILALCLQGSAACFSPRNLLQAALPGQQIRSLHQISLPSDAKYQIRFGVLKDNYQWKIIQEFIQTADAWLQAHNTENAGSSASHPC